MGQDRYREEMRTWAMSRNWRFDINDSNFTYARHQTLNREIINSDQLQKVVNDLTLDLITSSLTLIKGELTLCGGDDVAWLIRQSSLKL